MECSVSINDIAKRVHVHAKDCHFTFGNSIDDISQYHNSYDEAWDWISKNKSCDEFEVEDCSCCNPGNWNLI